MTTIEPFDLGWVVGILEGEGTFHVLKQYGAQIKVGMTDEDVIRRLYEVTGIGTVGGPYPSNGLGSKPMFHWVVKRNADVFALATLVLPHLGIRRAERAQACIDATRDGRSWRKTREHGTITCYQRGCREEACRQVNAAYQRSRYAARRDSRAIL